MEFILILVGVFVFYVVVSGGGRTFRPPSTRRIIKNALKPPRTPRVRQPSRTSSPKPKIAEVSPPTNAPRVIEGAAYVTDGDTIVIQKNNIRLYGIDAPEMNHPYGKISKQAMMKLCKGQTIRAEVTDSDDHGRIVAKCYLPDGRDLSEELVKLGLAIDWPKFSGGVYRKFETPDARKKMWLADARQKGRMHVWEKYEAQQKARAATRAE